MPRKSSFILEEAKYFWEENSYKAEISKKTFFNRVRLGEDLNDEILLKRNKLSHINLFYNENANDKTEITLEQFKRRIKDTNAPIEEWFSLLNKKKKNIKVSKEIENFWKKNKTKSEITYSTFLKRIYLNWPLNETILKKIEKKDEVKDFYNKNHTDSSVTLNVFRKKINALSKEEKEDKIKWKELLQSKNYIRTY